MEPLFLTDAEERAAGKTILPAVHISKTATAKEILAALDEWGGAYGPYNARWSNGGANREQQDERMDLWSVLTALRGPDNDDEQLKRETTTIIRHHALPKLADAGGAIVTHGSLDDVKERQRVAAERRWESEYKNEGAIAHFFNHVFRAVEVLQK